MKRLLSFLLCIALIFTFLPPGMVAVAAEGEELDTTEPATGWENLQVITPAVTYTEGSLSLNQRAFNNQPALIDGVPQWDGVYNIDPTMAGNNGVSRVGAFDFGVVNGENVTCSAIHITATWTKYRSSTYVTNGGNSVPFDELWWNSDGSKATSGTAETRLNFNTAQGVNTNSTTEVWIQDSDTSIDPVVPPSRYLMVRATITDNVGFTGRSNEFCIVGWIDKNGNGLQDQPVTGITVSTPTSPAAITINHGTLQMSAEVSPGNASNKNVRWSVSDEAVATVTTDGVLQVVGNGTVTVTATSRDGTQVTGSCDVIISGQYISVTGITVTGAEGATSITTDQGTLQMSAEVQPDNAAYKNVVWSVIDGTGHANIDADGLLTAALNGTVMVVASAVDDSGLSGELEITISNQSIRVSDINVSSEADADTITVDNGTLQFSAEVLPANAADKDVVWSVIEGTGKATIDQTGLLTAVADGSVTVRAAAHDGAGAYDEMVITLSNQVVPVGALEITSVGDANTITIRGGTLQLGVIYDPAYATHRDIVWSVENGTGSATISTTGLLTGVTDGTVTVIATSSSNPEVYAEFEVTLSSQAGNEITKILTPEAWGPVAGTLAKHNFAHAFDNQPDLLNPSTGKPGFSVTPKYVDGNTLTTGYPSTEGWGYIDFGENWQKVRILYTWTQYWWWHSGDYVPYDMLWWDDDKDNTVNEEGLNEPRINFNTAKGVPSVNDRLWILDSDVSNEPVTPQDRYLMLHMPANFKQGAHQYAIVGYIDEDGNGEQNAPYVPLTSIGLLSEGGKNQLLVGENLQISASVTPFNATNISFDYSLSDGEEFADITPTGLLTGVAPGVVTVRAQDPENPSLFATCNITVITDWVGISSPKDTIYKGESLKMEAVVHSTTVDADDYEWSIVSGADIALITRGGVLTAWDVGTVTVKATMKGGSGIFATYDVTVIEDWIEIRSDVGNQAMMVGDTLQMEAILHSYDIDSSDFQWSIESGEEFASINTSGLVTAIANGTVVIRADAIDDPGISATFNLLVSSYVSWVIPRGDFVNQTTGLTIVDIDLTKAPYSSMDWENIERIFIPAGYYDYFRIKNLPRRDAQDDPLIITNWGGQVVISVPDSQPSNQSISNLNGGTNWIFTGKYDPVLQTGDINYQGHGNGYENSAGNYGIEITHTKSTGLQIGAASGSSNYPGNFEISFIEISHNGFAGLQMKTDDNPAALMDNARIHDLYIHDTDAEGMYIGSTQNNATPGSEKREHKFTNLKIYNNRVVRAGSEAIQLGNMGDGVEVYNNVCIMSSIYWKNAFQRWQDGCFQYSQRDGVAHIYNNIFIGSAANMILMQFYRWEDDVVEEGDGVYFTNNYFSNGRSTLMYLKWPTQADFDHGVANTVSKLVFEDNYITNFDFQRDELNGSSLLGYEDQVDPNLLMYVRDNNYNPLYFTNNVISGPQAFIDRLGEDLNGTSGPVTAEGNTVVDNIEPFLFMDTTYPQDFDWSKVEYWVEFSELYNIPVYYNYGDYVVEYGVGTLYKCILLGTHDARDYDLSDRDVWEIVSYRTPDDYRLAPASVRQDMGLLDNVSIPVTGITVTAQGGVTSIDVKNQTLQMYATVTPAGISLDGVNWTIKNGTGEATIDQNGVVTPVKDGTVTVVATARDGSGVFDEHELTLSNQNINVTSITVSAANDAATVTTRSGTLQMTAIIAPPNVSEGDVIWSVVNGTGVATIDDNGLLTAILDGTVTVKAEAMDGSAVYGTLEVTISGQKIFVNSVTVSSVEGTSTVVKNKSLQMTAAVGPVDAHTKDIEWSVTSGTGSATINADGLLKALTVGNVTVKATAKDGSGIAGTKLVTITDEELPPPVTEPTPPVTESPVSEPGNKDDEIYVKDLPVNSINKENGKETITISSDIAIVSVKSNMLEKNVAENAKTVQISIAIADRTKLSDSAKALIANRPVIELSLSVDGKVREWNNPDSAVKVAIPYKITANELKNLEYLTVQYIDADGNLESVPTGKYDETTGMITFTANRFGNYAVAYVKKTLKNVNQEYSPLAQKAAEVMVSKGVTDIAEDGSFNPGDIITRAEAVVLLIRALGINASFESNFSDVDSSAVYADELGIARKLGLISGIGNNNFKPDTNISWQDMMTLSQKFVKFADKPLQSGRASDLRRFEDESQVAGYAKEGIASFIRSGLIDADGVFLNPSRSISKAELITFIYKIYNLQN